MNWHEYFSYDATTGNLIWKERPAEAFPSPWSCRAWNARYGHKAAGFTTPDGYILVQFRDKKTLAHRIIWEMHNGPIPERMQIDHKDGAKANNRLANLRLASNAQNARNRRLRKSSARFPRGVGLHKGSWTAFVHVDGQRKYLGCFATKGLAAVAYAKASLRYHGKFSSFYPHLPC